MPLQQIHISRFDGMYGGADARDLPPSVGAFSLNIDPVGGEGKIASLKSAASVNGTGGGRRYALRSGGSEAVFASGSGASSVLKRITGLGGATTVTTIFTPPAGATDGNICTASDGQAIHVGMGAGVDYKPKWVGEIAHGQFGGAAPVGPQVEDASIVNGGDLMFSIIPSTGADAEGDPFKDKTSYFYTTSLVYDSFQESPLSQVGVAGVYMGNTGNTAAYIDVNIQVDKALISKRVTHINIYRSESVDGIRSAWTFVASVSVMDGDGWTLHSEFSPTSYRYTFRDDYVVGQAYADRTGISPTLEDVTVHYGLSCEADGFHFVGRCYHSEFDASSYIFRSKAYRFDMFDWSVDYLKLPVVPVALTHFAGKLFAFCEGMIFIINPSTLSIMDTLVGAGTFSPESVCVTGRGMFFAGRDNLYFHDGTQVHPVGTPVLKNDYVHETLGGSPLDLSWLAVTHESSPVVGYDAQRDAFVTIFATDNPDGPMALIFGLLWSVEKRRFDYFTLGQNGTITGRLTAVDGTLHVGLNTGLYQPLRGADQAWTFVTPLLTFQDTLYATFYHARVWGTASLEYSEDEGAWIAVQEIQDGTGVRKSIINSGQPASWRKVRSLQLRITGAGGSTVEAIGIIHRPIKQR